MTISSSGPKEERTVSDRVRRRVRLAREQDGKTANKSKGANAHVAIVRMIQREGSSLPLLLAEHPAKAARGRHDGARTATALKRRLRWIQFTRRKRPAGHLCFLPLS